MLRRYCPDLGLGEPKMRYEDTFSAEEVIMETFKFKPERLVTADTDKDRAGSTVIGSGGDF